MNTTERTQSETAARVREAGVIAIIHGDYSIRHLQEIAGALVQGGVRVVEVTLNSADASDGIAALRRHTEGRMLVGAGTVRTAEDVDRALQAGAQFLVSPNVDAESVARSRQAGVLHLPGVFTASEAQQALQSGCRIQKLFPAGAFGPSYLRALSAPLDDIAFVPTGGINAENIADYVRAGAVAVGVGSALVTGAEQDGTDVTERARRLVAALQRARVGKE